MLDWLLDAFRSHFGSYVAPLWTFRGEGRFLTQGIREALGHVGSQNPPDSPKVVPPG